MSRHRPEDRAPPGAAIEQAASEWIARIDRGLSPDEAARLAAWEAADPRHATELARQEKTWRTLDTADEAPEIMQLAHALETPSPRRRWWPAAWVTLGAAAAVALFVSLALGPERAETSSPPQASQRSYKVVPSAAQRLTLADGTVVELNAGATVEPAFSAHERRVRLVRGEAHFAVTPNPARPFIVEAGAVAVRAVGTAFNVRFARVDVEVLVTEGKVRVDDAGKGESLLSLPAAETPVLAAGQRVVVPAEAPVPAAPVAVTPADVERLLGWQGTQLVFQRTPLDEAIAAFNSFNRRQLVLGDANLRARRLGGTFRADNLDAFVRLLETGFDLRAEPHGENEIVLRGAK